ncbi:MAG: DUF952 domain-containing protein [Acidobacteria bacterium]|nr:DUF952 domain-containing protein [Acidobacteriota bacterium]
MAGVIFKLVDEPSWAKAAATGQFDGSAIDARDGYIHLSTVGQVRETAARHFAGQPGLLLIAVAAGPLAGHLRWEPSRGGDLFPHLYGPLPLAAVRAVTALALDDTGRHVFPDLHAPPYTL